MARSAACGPCSWPCFVFVFRDFVEHVPWIECRPRLACLSLVRSRLASIPHPVERLLLPQSCTALIARRCLRALEEQGRACDIENVNPTAYSSRPIIRNLFDLVAERLFTSSPPWRQLQRSCRSLRRSRSARTATSSSKPYSPGPSPPRAPRRGGAQLWSRRDGQAELQGSREAHAKRVQRQVRQLLSVYSLRVRLQDRGVHNHLGRGGELARRAGESDRAIDDDLLAAWGTEFWYVKPLSAALPSCLITTTTGGSPRS